MLNNLSRILLVGVTLLAGCGVRSDPEMSVYADFQRGTVQYNLPGEHGEESYWTCAYVIPYKNKWVVMDTLPELATSTKFKTREQAEHYAKTACKTQYDWDLWGYNVGPDY